jgi:hypothetical protein
LVPAVAVLYTINPVAGLVIGLAALVAVKATLGGKKPLLVALTSNLAEASGVVVPIPVWANAPRLVIKNAIKTTLFI